MDKVKLYAHIGNGKTGSTSIQKVLEKERENLLENGILYIGRFMELAPVKLYEWQDFRKKDIFWSLTDSERVEQVSAVLRASLDEVKNISSIVWSHESFINRHVSMAPLLKSLQEEMPLDVYPVAYIRRHEDWSVSAYFQWGLKHKSTQGYKVPSFQEWMQTKPARLFSVVLNKWERDFREKFILRNFDSIEDPVDDFFDILNIENIREVSMHSYKSPVAEELFFRTIYNFSHSGEVLPGHFDKEVTSFPLHRHVLKPSEFSGDILPNKKSVEEEMLRHAEDKEKVNVLLAKKGQPALTNSGASFDYSLDQEKLLSIAIHMLIGQEKKSLYLKNVFLKLNLKIDNMVLK